MDGQDTDSILCIRSRYCFTISRFIPPFKEAAQVGTFFLGILGYHIEECLNKDLLIRLKITGEETEKSFRYFIQRLTGKSL